MPRFLHTADWQIGRSYPRFPSDDAAFLAQARIAVVERIAALASERRVDAVLVAGDVFDAQTVPDRTLRRLFNALAGFRGPWVMIPGNHDAALAAGVWSRARRLDCIPPNVRLLEQPGLVTMGNLGCAVLAAPLTQRQTHSDLTDWFDDEPSAAGLARIGLAHGCVAGILPDTVDSPNPIAADRAATARLDYLALGDWHGARRIDARTWYSGTPEQDRFKGNDPGHVLLVDIACAGAEPAVEMIPVGRYHWREWAHHFEVASDVDELERRLAALGADHVLALRLSGHTSLEDLARVRRILDIGRGRLRLLEADLDALRLRPTDADLAALAADGYVGEVLGVLRDACEGRGDEKLDATVAAEALSLLAGVLGERRA